MIVEDLDGDKTDNKTMRDPNLKIQKVDSNLKKEVSLKVNSSNHQSQSKIDVDN